MMKIILVASLIAVVAGQNDISQYGPSNLPHIQNCDLPCNMKASDPVCAFDGTRFNIYNDNCELLKSNCTFGYKLLPSPIQECLTPRTFLFDFCDFPCPNIERSICGKNKDGHTELFKNGCVMARQSCKERSIYKMVDINDCKINKNPEECSRVCPASYDPRCAYNGKEYAVFGNDCDLNVANCLQSNTWSPVPMTTCSRELGYQLDLPHTKENESNNGDNEEECPTVCKRVFWPICASNGNNFKIFSNECLFKKERCEKNQNWKKTDMIDCITSVID